MYPAAVIVGLFYAPMWVAQGKYVTTLAERHAKIYNEDVYGSFNGMFYGIFQLTQVSGNLISTLVLNAAWTDDGTMFAQFATESVKTITLPWMTKLWLYVSYGVSCGIGLVVLNIWVERLESNDQPSKTYRGGSAPNLIDKLCGRYRSVKDEETNTLLKLRKVEVNSSDKPKNTEEAIGTEKNVWSAFRFMVHPQLFLLIPVMLANGLEMGFAYSSLTGDVVTGNLGVSYVGWGMIVFGIVGTISSLFFGKVSEKAGPVICICLAFMVEVACIAWLYFSYDDLESDDWLDIFVVCGIWGFCDGITQTLLSALLGEWFTEDKEEAFANWKMWQSLGISIIFFIQDLVSLNTKLLLLTIGWCIGIVGLLFARYLKCMNRGYHPIPTRTASL